MLRNRYFWIVLFLVAIIGLTMEMSKRASSTSKQSLGDNLALNAMEIKPYSIDYKKGSLHTRTKKIKRSRKAARPARVAGEVYGDLKSQTQVAQSESMDLGAPPKSEEQKKKELAKKKKKKKKKGEDGEEEEEVEYDEDGNPIKKKKAEGEEEDSEDKEDKKDEEVADEETSEEDPEEDKEAEEDLEENTEVAGGGAVGALPVEPPEEQGENISEWAQALLKKPDFKLMTEFINLRQTNRISEAEFNSVIDLMLKDPRSSIQELAVQGLGSTPSISSFERLADVLKSANFGSGVSEMAQYYISTYSQLRYLSILEGVLRVSESTYAVLMAATQLDRSAERYLADTDSQSNDPDNPSDNPSGSTNNARFYTQFPTLLESIVNEVDDREAADAAQRALNRLKQLLPS